MALGAKTTGDESEGEMFHLSVLSFYFTVMQGHCVARPQLGFVIVYSSVGPLPCCLLRYLHRQILHIFAPFLVVVLWIISICHYIDSIPQFLRN